MRHQSVGYHIKKSLIYLFLIALAVTCMIPFMMMMVNATRDGNEILTGFSLIPSVHLKENWDTVFSYFNLFLGMRNSVLVAIPATLLSAYFSTLTAYGLAFYQFKGNKVIFIVILVFMMIPGQLSLIGFYQLCSKLKLVNSYIPLIVPAIAAPGTVFFLRQYILSTLPKSLVEAARMDGSNEFRIFNEIVLPIMKPAVAVQMIFSFVSSWNNFFMPALLLTKDQYKTVPIMIAQLRSADYSKFDMGKVFMFILLAILPVMIVYMFLSRFIIKGVTSGSVKG